jgi:hypothetical protein
LRRRSSFFAEAEQAEELNRGLVAEGWLRSPQLFDQVWLVRPPLHVAFLRRFDLGGGVLPQSALIDAPGEERFDDGEAMTSCCWC